MAADELSTSDHDRAAAGMTWVYPVISRRAGGVSVGINLNPNQACNWRCVYCQVPGLIKGSGPAVDLPALRSELGELLDDILTGDFLERRAPEGARQLVDLALSGDGEPTSSPDLGPALELVGEVLAERGLAQRLPLVLITNGSLVHQDQVSRALERLAQLGGVVWYKLDRATDEGLLAINNTRAGAERALHNLRLAAARCPTWIQPSMFALDAQPPAEAELEAWLAAVGGLVEEGVPLEGVLLYGLARPSHQPEAERLTALPPNWLDAFARRIESLGLPVRVSP